MRGSRILFALAFFVLVSATAHAQDAPISQQLPPVAAPTHAVQVQQLPLLDATPKFDAERATNDYLARVSGAARAKSDAYSEGGYLLTVVELVYALAIASLLLWLGISRAVRDWAAERTHWRGYQAMLYAAILVGIVMVASFPLAAYEGFFREQAYGLSNQSFLQWSGDYGIRFALILAAALIGVPILYAVIRAARGDWWIWGAAIAIVFQIAVMSVYPVAIAPLFNHYAPLPDSPLKQEILSLARANDVPADAIRMVDASRQSSRPSATVSGFLGTGRIALSDNLLKQADPDEVLAVTGPEIGHYAMGHATRAILLLGLMTLAGFAFANWGFELAIDLFGGNWHVRRIGDIAGLPLLAALAAIYVFLTLPVTNAIGRTMERQADIFGVNAVRKPDAFAEMVLKRSNTAKLDPGAWEEMIFYAHPSGRSRIETVMRWKKEHMHDPDIRLMGGPGVEAP